ncbi:MULTISPECIES: dicarboxylate/amino acid:cation symporter [Faecalicoccus]|mgnify:CR=1 FL=1|uniref:Dicarboxylate/amino acid:cation symporter n=2 Tax=Faecalicoccus pleomorphus TaxID=1323 RepID=A0A7X9RJ45_9FIRM|nr:MULTISPECIES: dicarboxylate/amino acid:cation symporter [Faecalicoccus]MCI6379424.1 dicarboxylate/amino acid:cation symporter [Erysipelotrichaceae bacterium]MDY4278344.1 dicarboxylate/amino acid:cation symporter [Faecalicoccus sp.]MDY5111922.1 dicarboxylate/amino acid:cation symporter [Faecalicoccus sp.]MDY5234096.1 dicarboxylate/amino acid:cation symporter [Faecalicoccus sp.]NME44111.1 dicarboxylate/amino acid:cation symporter [Faecalicoccus pleomorphus]
MKKNKEGKSSIVRRMIWAVVLGFMCGILMIILRENSTGDLSNAWKFVDALLFQDITTTKGIEGIGLFYIVGQIFMRGLQLAIVPLVLTSLSLALCSLADPKKLGRIAIKTFITYLCFYLAAATLAGVAAYGVKLTGGFDVVLPSTQAAEIATMEGYNPLVTIVNAVPNNIFSAFTSNNAILSVVVTALILGLCMTYLKDKAEPLKQVIESLNEVIQLFLNFLIDKVGPVAIFCMITRALAVYGVEYIRPTLVWMITTIVVSLVLVSTIYPIGIFLTTRLNPLPFMKKVFKVGLFAAATNSSAATLPLNVKTCTQELGCTEEISSFVLPTGMTINMNGTTAMHMIAITFIASAAGLDISPATLVLAAFLSICTAMGTPAIPVAGTTMVYVVMMGLGLNSELCMIGYSLVLAMNYLPGMAVITLNVIGDAATNVIVNFKEGVLNKEQYMEKSSNGKEVK